MLEFSLPLIRSRLNMLFRLHNALVPSLFVRVFQQVGKLVVCRVFGCGCCAAPPVALDFAAPPFFISPGPFRASFAEYTEAAVGIKQRQAYNYIQVVESLPARLIEENAAAGVTKLALLAKLNPEEREDLTGEALANITVAELKKLVEERDAMAQQLSIFQTEPEAVAEVEAEPIDPDEIRRQAEEETRQQMAAAFAEERTQLEAKHKAAMSECKRFS